MNIKRAFFAAVATLMVPGFAMAQTTITFDTQLDFIPDGPYTQTVEATLTCNTGNPLQQSFEIGPTTEDKVIFVVENFDLVEFISCEITTDPLSGFIAIATIANGDEIDGGTCLYTPQGEANGVVVSVPLITDGANTCVFQMAPAPFEFEIEKVWEFDGEEVDVSEFAAGGWRCDNVVVPSINNGTTTIQGGWDISGDGTYTVSSYNQFSTIHPNPWADAGDSDRTRCYAWENIIDSAVESDQGCSGGTTFLVGDTEGGCTITNTVFFEGIPTLSQYGMAIMALLMLGVGFIGFRRFV